MRDLVEFIIVIAGAIRPGLRSMLSRRNRRITLAVLVGGFTIAGANWIAMSMSPGESFMGLGDQGASGAVIAPVYGGIVTGLLAGFGKRPLYADAKAGTLAAFAGVTLLLVWAGIARATGDLPDGGIGFEKFGPISGAMFVLLIGSAYMFLTFPVAFVVIFTTRSFVPNNRHRYGWVSDDDDNPGLALVTPGPVNQGSLASASTARSRFRSTPPRYSSVPRRFMDAEAE